jgi:azobenzene reductase
MRVAIMLGSVRIGRQTHKVAYYLQRLLEERGVDVDMIDLLHHPLPLMEERVQLHPNVPPAVKSISDTLHNADAILLVTPEYHGSYSGVLKNALDYFRAEFGKKAIGVVTTSGGKLGGINASLQLQTLILHMGAYALPLKLLVPEIHLAIDDNYQPLQQSLVNNANKFLDEFLWLASAVATAKVQQLKNVA